MTKDTMGVTDIAEIEYDTREMEIQAAIANNLASIARSLVVIAGLADRLQDVPLGVRVL